jgi:hypothetical protein
MIDTATKHAARTPPMKLLRRVERRDAEDSGTPVGTTELIEHLPRKHIERRTPRRPDSCAQHGAPRRRRMGSSAGRTLGDAASAVRGAANCRQGDGVRRATEGPPAVGDESSETSPTCRLPKMRWRWRFAVRRGDVGLDGRAKTAPVTANRRRDSAPCRDESDRDAADRRAA